MNQDRTRIEAGSSSPVDAMTVQYERFFTPSRTAVRSGQGQAAFEIYSAVDYSIPVTFSSNSVIRHQERDA